MTIDAVLDLLRCPHCAAAFTRDGGVVACASGHRFDLARQGYLNLLGRRPPTNADTAAMVAARYRFLAGGAYAPIAAQLTRTVEAAAGGDVVLDVGAGSGYYLASVLSQVGGRGVALDISPYAARRAAGAHPQIGAVVADAWGRLPIMEQTVDVLLSVFAPRHAGEFARVLRPGGLLVVVAPLPDHLVELRQHLGLLEIEPGKHDRIAETLSRAFTGQPGAESRYELSLGADELADLVAMGPNAFHQAPDELPRRIAALQQPAQVTVAVSVTAWRRSPANVE